MSSSERALIGIVPAAGFATRLAGIGCSKEILPILPELDVETQPVCHALLSSFARAGADHIVWIIREGKDDIPQTLGDGSAYGVPFSYRVTGATAGTPHTLDRAYSFVKDARVLLGFPDIHFAPESAFVELVAHLERTKADITLGLLQTDRPEKMDVVEIDDTGNVIALRIKQPSSGNNLAWILAAWQPRFSDYLHHYLEETQNKNTNEVYVGTVIQSAIAGGLRVNAIEILGGKCIDVGTPEDLALMQTCRPE
ncbi:MAG: sugar phosphate nucleotidyltransferase [Pseudomonadota bacterium]